MIWKYIQDILLMEKSKEQKNIVCYHLGKRGTLYIQIQTPKRKYVNIKKYISILHIYRYIYTQKANNIVVEKKARCLGSADM